MVIKKIIAFCLALSGSWILSSSAFAVLIEYEQTLQAGNHYEYTYTVTNDSASTFDIAGISVYFDYQSFSNIQITASPVNWDPLYSDPIIALPFDGLADWYALGATIAAGEVLTGFSVAFDWVSSSLNPFMDQYFEIYDPISFDVIASGNIQDKSQPAQVSEPGAFVFLVLGFVSLICVRKFGFLKKGYEHRSIGCIG